MIGGLIIAACGGDDATDDGDGSPTEPSIEVTDPPTPTDVVVVTTPPTDGTGDTDADTATTDTTDDAPTETADASDTTTTEPAATTPPTLPAVTTTVVGTAVGGTAGSFGTESTDPFSEAIRNEDGTCTGWDPPQRGRWTGGLASGAPVVVLERDSDRQIGSGQVGTSAWVDVDPSGTEQWNCVFPFTIEVEGTPETFRIKIADLDPWVARPDPTAPGAFVVSVDTFARWEEVESCVTDRDPEFVAEWEAVGVFWSRGVDSLCNAGLAVVEITRSCRPEGFASESVLAVTTVADPPVVVDDVAGRRVAPDELEPLTEVSVDVAVGRPC